MHRIVFIALIGALTASSITFTARSAHGAQPLRPHTGAARVIRVQLPASRVEHDELRPGVSYIGTVSTVANFSGSQLNGLTYNTDDGHVYVIEGSTLYRIETTGQTTQIASFSSFGFINSIVWDSNSHLFYVSCPQDFEVLSVDAVGTIKLVAGGAHGTLDGTGSHAQFQYPSGIGLDPGAHLLYVADNDRMRSITEAGKVVTVGPTGALNGNFFGQSYGVVFDPNAKVLGITDAPADSVITFTPSGGTYQAIAGRCLFTNNQTGCLPLFVDGAGLTALFALPAGIAYDPTSDAFYVADQTNFMLRRVTTSGSVARIAGSGQAAIVDGVFLSASFGSPSCATLDPSTGNVLICDSGLLRVVTTSGQRPPDPHHSFAMRTTGSLLSGPTGMVTTSDGSIWFAERSSDALGRVLPNRKLREYPMPGGYTQPYDPAVGPDGNVWFVDASGLGQFGFPSQADIGEITLAGTIGETKFPNQCGPNATSYPFYLAPDPAGNVWFAGTCPTSLGFETPQRTFTQYVAPQFGGLAIGAGPVIWADDSSHLYEYSNTGRLIQTDDVAADAGVAIGPDGNIWVLSSNSQSVSKVNPNNGTTVTYQLPNCGCSRNLGHLVAGPDGALWFTEGGGQFNPYLGAIGRISITGHFVEYPTYEPRSQPSGIAFDVGGTAWIADLGANKIGRMR